MDGTGVAMVTPFTADGDLDEAARSPHRPVGSEVEAELETLVEAAGPDG